MFAPNVHTALNSCCRNDPHLCYYLQDYVNSILTAANAIPKDANTALLIFDDLVTILNVDVDITSMNSDVAVSS